MSRPCRPLRRALVAVLAPGWAAACGADAPPTFAEDVASILYQSCASCHRAEGVAPFELQSYDDAAPVADLLAAAVAERRMPPWLPAPSGPVFAGDRRLTEDEIETLVRWAEAGAPRGEPSLEPEAPVWPSGWILGEPEVVLRMSDTFTVRADGPDFHRTFALPVVLDSGRWVRAVELRPGNTRVVHHATMAVDRTGSSRLAEGLDSVPGYDEMYSRTDATLPGGFFLGWTPGRVPTPSPAGTSWRLEPGTDFIVEFHLRSSGQAEQLSAEVGLHFANTEPTEIPLLLRLGEQTLDIPAGDSAYVVEDSLRLPVDVRALSAYPHAHYLARTMRVWAELPDGGELTLVEIPRWDFNWQDAYRYADPIELPAGTILRLRYVFDNSAANPHNPSSPPRRVVFGRQSSDEMAEFHLQTVPARVDDMLALRETLAQKALADQTEAFLHLLRLDSNDAEAHFGLGALAQLVGDLDEAIRRYRLAVRFKPDYAQAHYNMALVLENQGAPADALASYLNAIQILPNYPAALSNVGRLQAGMGELGTARGTLERAVELEPTNAEALNNLGNVLWSLGQQAEAESRFRQAIDARPGFSPAHFNLALSLVVQGRAEEGLEELNAGLEGEGDNLQAALSVAWALATDASADVRRPELAVDLANQIRAFAGFEPAIADVQAAAYASMGDFERAVGLVQDALASERERGDPVRIAEVEGRLALYRRGRAYVQPGG